MHIFCATRIGGYMFLQHCSSGGGHKIFDHPIRGSQKYCRGTFGNSWPPIPKKMVAPPKSRRPFATSGKDLLSTALPNKTKAHWIAWTWSAVWQPSTSRLREYIVSPSKCCPGSDLQRQAWVKLNRLRTGIGRFNADMWKWGLSKSPASGADQQPANHIITECPLYRPPNGLHGLIDVDTDATTRDWLLGKFPEIELFLLFYGFHTQEEEEEEEGEAF